MIYCQPVRMMIYNDLVALFIPRLKDILDPIFTLVEEGERDVPTCTWGLHTWAGGQSALALEVDHHGLEFAVVFMPRTWDELMPAIMNAKTIGIVADREYWDEEKGEVTGLYLDEHNVLRRSMYKVFNNDAGLRGQIPQLRDLKQRWDPNGVVTYLLHTLGESLENPSATP